MAQGEQATRRTRSGLAEIRRIALWALAATGAVAVTLYASRTPEGEGRLAQAYTTIRNMTAAQLMELLRPGADARNEQEEERRRLAESVNALTADRDRLAKRIEALERSVEDLTGSIARSASTLPKTDTPAPVPAIDPPPSVPAVQPPVDANATRTEFGIDLGGGSNVEALRALWAAARTRHASLLNGLRPVVAIREHKRPGGVELRLVAGPLANAATAARLCAAMTASGALCQPTVFDGQRLAVR